MSTIKFSYLNRGSFGNGKKIEPFDHLKNFLLNLDLEIPLMRGLFSPCVKSGIIITPLSKQMTESASEAQLNQFSACQTVFVNTAGMRRID